MGNKDAKPKWKTGSAHNVINDVGTHFHCSTPLAHPLGQTPVTFSAETLPHRLVKLPSVRVFATCHRQFCWFKNKVLSALTKRVHIITFRVFWFNVQGCPVNYSLVNTHYNHWSIPTIFTGQYPLAVTSVYVLNQNGGSHSDVTTDIVILNSER